MKSTSITFITLNAIDKQLSHASQMHIRAYIRRVYDPEPYSGIQWQRKHLWTLVDPNMYMRHVDIFSHYSLYFSYLIFPQKDFIISHIIDNYMTDFPYHNSIMYDFTPPIFPCLLHILLSFVRTFSPSLHV